MAAKSLAFDRTRTNRALESLAGEIDPLENATLAKDSPPPWVNFLDNGRIAQVGTHEKLMEEDGHYREAALSQCAA